MNKEKSEPENEGCDDQTIMELGLRTALGSGQVSPRPWGKWALWGFSYQGSRQPRITGVGCFTRTRGRVKHFKDVLGGLAYYSRLQAEGAILATGLIRVSRQFDTAWLPSSTCKSQPSFNHASAAHKWLFSYTRGCLHHHTQHDNTDSAPLDSGRFRQQAKTPPVPANQQPPASPLNGPPQSPSTLTAPSAPQAPLSPTLSAGTPVDRTNSSDNMQQVSSPAPRQRPPFYFREAYSELTVKGNFMTLATKPEHVEKGEWFAHQGLSLSDRF